jgi:hypothetical protein
VVRATIPAANSWVLTQISQFVDLSHKNPKGEGKLRKGGRKEGKMKEVREMEAPSSYLTRLLHNPNFAPRYFESNHLTRERYGPTRGNLHSTATTPFMR